MQTLKAAAKISWRKVIWRGAGTILVMGILVVVGGWLAMRHYSMEQRFARSKGAFEAFGLRVMAADPAVALALPQHLGEFEVEDAHQLPHGIFFRANYGHPLDWNGFAFSTENLPREFDDPGGGKFQKIFCKPIGGNWYSVDRN